LDVFLFPKHNHISSSRDVLHNLLLYNGLPMAQAFALALMKV
jgi:hypothetical protein